MERRHRECGPRGRTHSSQLSSHCSARSVQATVVMPLLSPGYVESRWCVNELVLAKRAGVTIFPVCCEKTVIPKSLQLLLWRSQITDCSECVVWEETKDGERRMHADECRRILG